MGDHYREGPRVEVRANAEIPTKIDGERFVELFLERLSG